MNERNNPHRKNDLMPSWRNKGQQEYLSTFECLVFRVPDRIWLFRYLRQTRKPVLDDADCKSPTRRLELHNTVEVSGIQGASLRGRLPPPATRAHKQEHEVRMNEADRVVHDFRCKLTTCKCQKLHVLGKNPDAVCACLYISLVYDTSWLKLIVPIFVRHELSLQPLLECHIFSMILTAMNSGRG